MNEYEIFDMTEENKPQKSFSKKTKKRLKFLASAVVGIAIAVAAIMIFNSVFRSSGADTPEEAVMESLKADLIYDIDGMIKYSSEYNKIVKGDQRVLSDEELRDYLNNFYEGMESGYDESKFVFELISVRTYEKGESKFNSILEQYLEKVPDAEDKIDEIAIVRMSVDNGKSSYPNGKAPEKNYVAVKYGGRWYFAFGYVEETVQ